MGKKWPLKQWKSSLSSPLTPTLPDLHPQWSGLEKLCLPKIHFLSNHGWRTCSLADTVVSMTDFSGAWGRASPQEQLTVNL